MESGLARIVTRSELGEGRESSTVFCRGTRTLRVRDPRGLPESSSGVSSWESGRSSVVCRRRFRKLMPVSSSSTEGVFRFRRRRDPSVMSPSESGGISVDSKVPPPISVSVDLVTPASDICVSAITAEAPLAFDIASSLSRRPSSSSTVHSGHLQFEGAVSASAVSTLVRIQGDKDAAYKLSATSPWPPWHIADVLYTDISCVS